MERLQEKWWVPLLGVVGFALLIYALAPRYTDLQVAGTAAAFRDAAADVSDGRSIGAAVADIFFAMSYFTLGVALTRPLLVSRIGLGILGIGAVADFVENTLVGIGVAKGDEVTNGYVDTIRAVGALKWTCTLLAPALILAGLFLARRRPE